MKKFVKRNSTWFFIAILFFSTGTIAVFLWNFSLFDKDENFLRELKSSSEICLSKKFPGKSVSIEDLNPQTHSIFEDKEFMSDWNDEFYSAFQEEKYKKNKFFDEKSLPEITTADEIYRFFWLRTFDNPVMIKIYRIKNEKFIITKKLSGKSGFEKGTLIFNETRRLNNDEWCKFITLLDKSDFWNKEKIKVSELAYDGSFWLIEGISDRRYYSAGEQSPDAGDFRDSCLDLMKISGLDIDKSEEDFY